MSMLPSSMPWLGYGAMSTMPGSGIGGAPMGPPPTSSMTSDGIGGAPQIPTIPPIPQGQQFLMQQAGNGQGIQGAPAGPTPQQIADYKAKQAYNANPPVDDSAFVYNPSGNLGYGANVGLPVNAIGYGSSGYGGGGYGGSGQDPNQLDAISRMGAAQAGAQGQIGAAQARAGGDIGAAQATADASKFGATQGLAGTLNTNTTNKDIATGNNATQMGLGQLGLQGTQVTAADQLAGVLGSSRNALTGVQTTAADQLQASLANTNNQVPLQNAANAVGLAQVGLGKDKLGLASQLLTGGGVGGVGIGGGGSGGAGGGTNGAPPLPPSQVINPLILQQAINHSQNGIQSRYDSLANNMKQSLASRGFDTSNAAGGLPPGLQQQILQGESPELSDAALQWNLGAAGQNAQQGNTVASQGLSLYNAQQDRTLRQQLANLGLIGSLVS